ncbi:MAG TPA: DUF4445 domain-containing protein [Candidatus Acetatifactor stercoripullorum]|uniref:DUF4445 domain-containing protein n=1 Tax=Candidatus Acetatifactor stercoripullorum TaxID=2838414 RepID=A0A9D1R1N3_9FIRM|nr:ASKHA domain-containing protein [uncultured Acetatifactor sp.]HIW80046.1 DUF4445 domain-containing protein [Candidatus Acetatifactor stercoripullorum]
MSDERKKGLRCDICTGCGRCPGTIRAVSQSGQEKRLQVVTDSVPGLDFLEKEQAGSGMFIAADIGTTTIAMELCDERGRRVDSFVSMNPQAAYGADVISRIQAAGESKKALAMQRMARQTLARGIRQFQKKAPEQEQLFMVIAANTTMSYLLMGWDTGELGRAPFFSSHLKGESFLLEGIPCYLLPGLSAFVGGDIAAGIYACGMTCKKGLTLLIDLGTNGEMALGNCDRVLACATAAGPAFEGGANRGIFGADMVSLTARLLREGILDETGLLTDPYFETGIRIGDVCVTQQSIRAIQLAKGAIAAGIEILMKAYPATADAIEQVVLAGGFGYYLKPEDAAGIGLLPGRLASKALAGGNTALAGARLAGVRLLQAQKGRDEAWERLKEDIFPSGCSVEIKNLAREPDFEALYLEAMNLG